MRSDNSSPRCSSNPWCPPQPNIQHAGYALSAGTANHNHSS